MHLKPLTSWLGVTPNNFCCTNHVLHKILMRKHITVRICTLSGDPKVYIIYV